MADTDTSAETNKPSAFISERHRNPAEMMAQTAKGNYTWAGICAILATLVFLAMLALLWVDWTAIQAA
jgi:hypothetical protein